MGMMTIDEAVREVTHVREPVGWRPPANVWVYGEMLWSDADSFAFNVLNERRGVPRDERSKRVTVIAGSVKKYRDNETRLFLLEMSPVMAEVMEIEAFVLTDEEVEGKKRVVDTSREF